MLSLQWGAWLLSSRYGASQKAQMVTADERYKHILQNLGPESGVSPMKLKELDTLRFMGDKDALYIAFQDLKHVLKSNPTLVEE